MGKSTTGAAEPGFAELVEGIIADVEKLVGQQFDLFRQEVKQELGHAKHAVASGAAGAGLAALAGILSTQMVVHLVHRSTRLPLWASYGLVSGVLGAAGVSLLERARRHAGGVRLSVPRQTAETLQENMAWLKEQATAGRT